MMKQTKKLAVFLAVLLIIINSSMCAFAATAKKTASAPAASKATTSAPAVRATTVIAQAQAQYNAAKAAGNTAGMALAHATAEAARSLVNPSYTGSVNGSTYNPPGNSTATVSSSSLYKATINNLQQSYVTASASNNTAAMDTAHAAAEQYRKLTDASYVGSASGSNDATYKAIINDMAKDPTVLKSEYDRLTAIVKDPSATDSQKKFAAIQAQELGMKVTYNTTTTKYYDINGKEVSKLDPSAVSNNDWKDANGKVVPAGTAGAQPRFLGVDANGNKVTNPSFPDEASPLVWQDQLYKTKDQILADKTARNLIGYVNPVDNVLSSTQKTTIANTFLASHPDWTTSVNPATNKIWTAADITNQFVIQAGSDGIATLRSVHVRDDGGLYYKSFAVNTVTAVPIISYSIQQPPKPVTVDQKAVIPTTTVAPQPVSSTVTGVSKYGNTVYVTEKYVEMIDKYDEIIYTTVLHATAKLTIIETGQSCTTDDTNGQDKKLKTKSGYGIKVDLNSNIVLTCSNPSYPPDASQMALITNASTAWIEMNGTRYPLETGTSNNNPNSWSRSFATPVNSNSSVGRREYFLPVNLPDGEYNVKIGIEGATSPVGTMNKYLDAKFIVDKNMHVDDNSGITN